MNIIDYFRRLFRRKPIVGYVSDIDKFLAEFDARNPKKSASQLKEIKKYQKIYQLRDNPERTKEDSKIWSGF